MSYQRIRIRARINTADLSPSVEAALYREGSREVLTVGPSDTLSIDYMQLSHPGAAAVSVFFEEAGADSPTIEAGSVIYNSAGATVTNDQTAVVPLPHPMVGQPGEGLWASGGDTQAMRAVFSGWLVRG